MLNFVHNKTSEGRGGNNVFDLIYVNCVHSGFDGIMGLWKAYDCENL